MGSGGAGGTAEGGQDGGVVLLGEDGCESAGAVAEEASGDAALGAGAAVSAGGGVLVDAEAGPADGAPQLAVAEVR